MIEKIIENKEIIEERVVENTQEKSKEIEDDYEEELKKAMTLLGEHEKTIFIGQTVGCKGSAMFGSLENVSMKKRIELPVFEDVQMGMSIGLALEGFIPVSIYPRMDFLILAINQLVNHLDKMEQMSCGQFKPKVIIRTAIGGVKPLFPGPQHNQDHTQAIKALLTNVNVVKIERKEDILYEYKKALESDKSTILIEMSDLYHAK